MYFPLKYVTLYFSPYQQFISKAADLETTTIFFNDIMDFFYAKTKFSYSVKQKKYSYAL